MHMVTFTTITIMQVLPILAKHSQSVINNWLQMPKSTGTRIHQTLKHRCKAYRVVGGRCEAKHNNTSIDPSCGEKAARGGDGGGDCGHCTGHS